MPALPAGAVLAYDTRLWTEGDPTLENIGSAGATYDLDILEDLAYDNLYGTQANDYYAFLDTRSAGIDWTDFGGTPGVAGVFTFIYATGNTGDGAGYANLKFDGTTANLSPTVVNYDGTIAGPEAVADFPHPVGFLGPTASYNSPGAADDTVYFFEVDLTGTPYVEIRETESIVVAPIATIVFAAPCSTPRRLSTAIGHVSCPAQLPKKTIVLRTGFAPAS